MINPTNGLAIVTGAGTGLGRAMAIQLVQRGMRVAGFGRHVNTLAQTAQIAGPGFMPCVVDVSSPDDVSRAINRLAAAEAASIAILINNAAVYPRRDFMDETPQSFMHSVSVNLGGAVNCTHAALRHMIPAGQGRILNVSTFADLAPIPASSAYSVSKGAARIFTRSLLMDIGDRFPDIIINDWLPGMLATDMGVPHGLDPVLAASWGVELALRNDRTLSGTIWERDLELLPPQSLKRRIKDFLLLRKKKPRRLSSLTL